MNTANVITASLYASNSEAVRNLCIALAGPLKRHPEEVLAAALWGADMGLGLMASQRMFYVISGRITLAAAGYAALARRHPECKKFATVKHTNEGCAIEVIRGSNDPMVVQFTMQDAKQAGLTGSQTWRKFPKAMLYWRCAQRAALMVFPDACAGFVGEADLAEEAASVSTD